MTRTELTDLLHRHVEAGDPGEAMAVADVVRRGQRRVRRRRTFGAITCAAVVAAVVVLTPTARGFLPRGDRAGSGIDPATRQALVDYDAATMPRLIDEHVRSAFAGTADLSHKPGSRRFLPLDGQDQILPKKDWDKASSMTMQYDEGSRRYRAYLGHAKSEAEGNARDICAGNLSSGYTYTCSVDRTDAGVATTTISAVLLLSHADAGQPGWSWAAITRSQVDRGVTPHWLREDVNKYDKLLDPADLWFVQTVKVVHSETFVTTTSEYVHASSYAAALRMFRVPASALTTVATDPVLVIPQPPVQKNGCVWQLHSEDASC